MTLRASRKLLNGQIIKIRNMVALEFAATILTRGGPFNFLALVNIHVTSNIVLLHQPIIIFMEFEVNPKQPPWPIIGLTGNIACGKTLATNFFANAGFVILDADMIARDLVKPGAIALEEIHRTFGPSVFLADGSLDRRKLNDLIFSDGQAKAQLEGILHPKILHTLEGDIANLLKLTPKPYILFSAALLFEGGLNARCAGVLLIDCLPEMQIQRLHRRNGFAPEAAQLRMNSQWPADQKRMHSQWVVENNTTPEAFIEKLSGRVAEMKAFLNPLLGNK